ncbi:hypothetical protein LTR62_003142 [Meristemomyces frigidus]|uniref:Uncharacterized protein n=1 Tax=Meristemomyces frigidus TaxID=1508187 RepID=A0AAN7TLF2_9PEZI|nr:hypothetical protein LTR62_003142 [Meristemomyces frigidus]
MSSYPLNHNQSRISIPLSLAALGLEPWNAADGGGRRTSVSSSVYSQRHMSDLPAQLTSPAQPQAAAGPEPERRTGYTLIDPQAAARSVAASIVPTITSPSSARTSTTPSTSARAKIDMLAPETFMHPRPAPSPPVRNSNPYAPSSSVGTGKQSKIPLAFRGQTGEWQVHATAFLHSDPVGQAFLDGPSTQTVVPRVAGPPFGPPMAPGPASRPVTPSRNLSNSSVKTVLARAGSNSSRHHKRRGSDSIDKSSIHRITGSFSADPRAYAEGAPLDVVNSISLAEAQRRQRAMGERAFAPQSGSGRVETQGYPRALDRASPAPALVAGEQRSNSRRYPHAIPPRAPKAPAVATTKASAAPLPVPRRKLSASSTGTTFGAITNLANASQSALIAASDTDYVPQHARQESTCSDADSITDIPPPLSPLPRPAPLNPHGEQRQRSLI